jgi:hypothetical protein
VQATVSHILRWRGRAARSMRYTTPWFLVGKGAWRLATGRTRAGEALIARGLQLAEDRHLLGELYELHLYLALLRASNPAQAARHTAAAGQLLTR